MLLIHILPVIKYKVYVFRKYVIDTHLSISKCLSRNTYFHWMHNNKVIVTTTYKHMISARCNTRHFAFITSLGLYHRLSSSVFLSLFYRWGNRLSTDLVLIIYSEVEQLFQMRSGQPGSMCSVFYRISGICIMISQVNRPEASIFHIRVLEFFLFLFFFVSQEKYHNSWYKNAFHSSIYFKNEWINNYSLRKLLQINLYNIVVHKLGSCGLIDLRVYIIKFKCTMRHLKEA